MFKALNARDRKEVVILDPKWLGALTQLRELDRQDILLCQGCKQPVRVRAGEQRREHFAHKHLANCKYEDESAALRDCRAVLYQWLLSKFGENVSIEKQIDGINLIRPIDCWVTKGSKIFAYWIFDSAMTPEKRRDLEKIVTKLGVQFHWVFDLRLLKTKQDCPEEIILSTTERYFIRESKYDALYSDELFRVSGTLHYLDSENRTLTTFRGTSLCHAPQIYKGNKMTNEMEKILISPNNGEPVHSGEHEKFKEYENKKRTTGAFESTRLEIPFTRRESQVAIDSMQSSQRHDLLNKSGKCIFCGEVTYDWWDYDGTTGHCRCRTCFKQGKFRV